MKALWKNGVQKKAEQRFSFGVNRHAWKVSKEPKWDFNSCDINKANPIMPGAVAAKQVRCFYSVLQKKFKKKLLFVSFADSSILKFRRMMDVQAFFTQLNAYFDKIFVITLRRASDRQAHIQQELEGLHYDFFYGRDKQEFSVGDLEQKGIYSEALSRRHHRYGKPMQPGMIGCAWSHADVYRHMIQEGYHRVLILEDDVVIDKTQVHIWPEVMRELPRDWELFYLGFAEKETVPSFAFFKKALYHLQRSIGSLTYSHKTISNLYPKKVGKHVFKAGYHDCTHAYGLTKAGAEKLLALQTPISFVADNLLAHAATNELVKAYIIQPKIINQQYQVGTSSVSYLNH